MKNVVRLIFVVIIAQVFLACATKKNTSTNSGIKNLNTSGISSVSKKESIAQYKFIQAEGLYVIEEYENALSSLDTVLLYSPNNPAVYHKMSQCYERLEDYEDAEKLAVKAISLNNKNEHYHLQLANVLELQKDQLKTIEAYKDLISNIPNSDKYYLKVAENYNELALSSKKKFLFHQSQSGEGDKALASTAKLESMKLEQQTIDAFSSYEKSYKLTDDQFLRKQELCLSLNKEEQAISESLNRLKDGKPELLWNHVTLISRLKSTSQAISFMDMEELKEISDLEKARVKGLLFAQNNQLEKSRAQFLEIFRLENTLFSEKAKALRTILDSNSYASLVPLVTEDIDEYEKAVVSAEASELLGDFYAFNSTNKKLAKMAYERSLRISPNQESVLTKLVNTAYDVADYETVVSYGEKLLIGSNMGLETFDLLARAYVQKKDYPKALSVLHLGLNSSEKNYAQMDGFYHSLANIHEKIGDYDSLYFYLEKSLEFDVNNGETINKYCNKIIKYGGDIDIARANGERMIRLFPSEGKYLKTYANVLSKDEDYKRSLVYIEKAIENGQGDWSTCELAGDIAKNAGNLAKAKTYWKKSKSLGNSSTELENKINE